MEIFCGKAKLSKRLRAKQFQVISVDHVALKGVPILKIDISKADQRKVLEELILLDKVLYVHFAPPCGTASAARNIQPGPPPLRSVRFPMGLPNLSFAQRQRVGKANFLYAWTCKVILMLSAKGIAWSVENPASSLMWVTDPFLQLLEAIPDLIAFSFHTCMFAAKRKKDTALWTSVAQLRTHLERKCDGTHEHHSWGKTATGFATAEECAYNDTLSSAWAEAIFDYALASNFTKPAETVLEIQASTANATYLNKAILGCLPRGRKLLPLPTESLQPQQFDIAAYPEIQTLALGKRIPDHCSAFPKGSKLLRFLNVSGGDNVDAKVGLPKAAVIGIPKEPGQFLAEACKLVHPTVMAMSVGGMLVQNILSYNDPSGLQFRRIQCEFANKLVSLCGELREAENVCRQQMEVHVRKVLASKRTVLFQQLLDDMKYPDSKIALEMQQGFPLSGWLPASEVFPTRVRPPELHIEHLFKMSKVFSARSIAATKSSGCVDSDRRLWEATLEEVADGFLEGPFSRSDLGPRCVVSPRFGLQQKNKLRPIDNFSASQVNSATGLQDKFVVDSVDEICAIIKTWMQQSGDGLKLLGKTYDMRKAYRQIAIRGEHLDLAWISVWNPEKGEPSFFRMHTMPFGASSSVAAFLRVSQAIKAIGIACACLVWTSFYDDYVCICPEGTEVQTDRMVRLLFSSLGWKLAEDPEKDKPFSTTFHALGVEFNLEQVPHGSFSVGNTPARKEELRDRLTHILDNDSLEPQIAESLRSRLLFADAQIFGRFSKMALHSIGRIGLMRSNLNPLTLEVRRVLEWFKDHVLTGAPRTISCVERETFFLFLDGACSEVTEADDWSGVAIGAVLADRHGRLLHYFGHVVSSSLVKTWGRADQVQHVFEAEVLPYAICLWVWEHLLKHACVFVFIDNEAAKACWIAGFAQSTTARRVIHNGTMKEAAIDLHPFFARVPTHSNLGDDPSRGRFNELERLGAKRTHLDNSLITMLCTTNASPAFECRGGACD